MKERIESDEEPAAASWDVGPMALLCCGASTEDDLMLDHLSIQCADSATSGTFYDAVLTTLGGRRVMDFGEVVGFGTGAKPEFWIGPRATGEGFRECHIAFVAPSRAAVRQFFDAATGLDAQVLHEPRLWPEYHANFSGHLSAIPMVTMSRQSVTSRSRRSSGIDQGGDMPTVMVHHDVRDTDLWLSSSKHGRNSSDLWASRIPDLRRPSEPHSCGCAHGCS